jgi:hypothetical protein
MLLLMIFMLRVGKDFGQYLHGLLDDIVSNILVKNDTASENSIWNCRNEIEKLTKQVAAELASNSLVIGLF